MKIPTVPVTKKEPYKYPGIPEPRLDLESLYETVEVMKEIVETLIGQRGDGGFGRVGASGRQLVGGAHRRPCQHVESACCWRPVRAQNG